MATYKVIQDIEAEDKILGPLTLRQFIFALVAAFCLYMSFIVFVKHLWPLLIVFLPPALFCAFFAVPFGQDQPTEIWFLAKLRFWFKPRRRIWNQSGVKELVTITAPKKIERVLTNGLSQTEVKSRLKALADTIDSRGWAVKHAADQSFQPVIGADSDRLIDISNLPQEVPSEEPETDMLDSASNPIARQFDSMITRSSQLRRQQLIDKMNDVREQQAAQAKPAADNWFMPSAQSGRMTTTPQTRAGTPDRVPSISVSGRPSTASSAIADGTEEEARLAAQLSSRASSKKASFRNLHTLRPAGSVPAPTVPANSVATDSNATQAAVTPPVDPAILSLAQRDDLNVATLAREAQKSGSQSSDEVVISLH